VVGSLSQPRICSRGLLDAGDFGLAPGPLAFKLETVQHTGSFKPRGAFANLLTRQVPTVGVVAASGGNHGVAVAFAARRLGIKATIFRLQGNLPNED
jgi:threonine dehydratase